MSALDTKPTVVCNFRFHPELRDVIAEDADARQETMNEVAAAILAKHYKRPELGKIPRKRRRRTVKT